ncbi:tRNA (adenosine(37)-N6)-threonylcarbamoyltransferase complex transferase subunit TsaD [Candidatus Haliotispira prima]|uniref:tRNA N6-adenosine threonylcarbamoyltransferase n=1 Tax=Candidatus Haliotispira prima TaxID=3034016 RepID=A0ABY8MIU0_9SPIO|nr:tRNA (adenosine(37)-N6)-threonylcarbamoyltransferase complex transferase subunit TsaD [Candidatus Haliotispira prima]
MRILGIESSCDECAAAVVEDGRWVHSNIIASQIEQHKLYDGVVPEIAARLHCEWISNICTEALEQANCRLEDMDAIAVTNQPGMIGALLVGLSFAKGLAWAGGKPLIAADHILAHLYVPKIEVETEQAPDYPYIGLLVSGGHTMICVVHAYNNVETLGASIDDACGEAFDKIAKHYGLGYPGGAVIDRMAQNGDAGAYIFPQPKLKNSPRDLDVSFSGLKTAAIWQHRQFLRPGKSDSLENLLASYQKAIVDMLLDRVTRAVECTGLRQVAIGGGVAANSYLRSELERLSQDDNWQVSMPSPDYCTDNAVMIAAIAYEYAREGRFAGFDCSAYSRVDSFRSVPRSGHSARPLRPAHSASQASDAEQDLPDGRVPNPK